MRRGEELMRGKREEEGERERKTVSLSLSSAEVLLL
jgi:hypothetical protein